MKDLLQKLWDEYRSLLSAIDEHCEELEYEQSVERLIEAISDTKEMVELRAGLRKAGVKNISGLSA